MIRTCKKDFFLLETISDQILILKLVKGLVVLCQKVGFSINMALKWSLRGNKL